MVNAMKTLKFVLPAVLLAMAWAPGGQAEVARKTTTRLDVPYVNDGNPRHCLDIYFPAKKNKPSAILVHLHGGGWKTGDKKQMDATGRFYAARGIIFIAPDYRLTPEVMHPGHVEDCAAALNWVFTHSAELGGDRNRIFLSGHSAGAHLAALLATNPKYMMKYNITPADFAGIIPVDTASFNLLSDSKEWLVKRLIKKAFGKNKEILKEASPFYNVTDGKAYPKFLILNTSKREAAAAEGNAFADKLLKAGGAAQFVAVADHTHRQMAQGMYDAADPVGKSILQFILKM